MAVVLHRFPMVDDSTVLWHPWGAEVDDVYRQPAEVADCWDSNSRLRFFVGVSVDADAVRAIAGTAPAELMVTATCHATSTTRTSRAPLQENGPSLSARTMVELIGNVLAERLDLSAALIAPSGDHSWLATRIISQGPFERVPLQQDANVFPISAVSFRDQQWREAPWRFDIFATDLADAFSTGLRLFLNLDLPLAAALLDDTASQATRGLLDMVIARQLIATASGLAEGTAEDVDAVAAENPDSIAAAAANVATKYFHTSLKEATRSYRDQPERFEYLLAAETSLLRSEA
ncbi:hypothetical protein [Micrococcus aloeverae]|nr:hypothetical protein [Micrococcus luteus]MCV7573613.1 hypothetical protein [Micrococcus luteus]MCV7592062.1 hypothetical protein [Micrococcus luteus]